MGSIPVPVASFVPSTVFVQVCLLPCLFVHPPHFCCHHMNQEAIFLHVKYPAISRKCSQCSCLDASYSRLSLECDQGCLALVNSHYVLIWPHSSFQNIGNVTTSSVFTMSSCLHLRTHISPYESRESRGFTVLQSMFPSAADLRKYLHNSPGSSPSTHTAFHSHLLLQCRGCNAFINYYSQQADPGCTNICENTTLMHAK